LAYTAVCNVPSGTVTLKASNDVDLNVTERNADRAVFIALIVSPPFLWPSRSPVASMSTSAPSFERLATDL
jgi:hypothetical protein